jgi:hypothetical protein
MSPTIGGVHAVNLFHNIRSAVDHSIFPVSISSPTNNCISDNLNSTNGMTNESMRVVSLCGNTVNVRDIYTGISPSITDGIRSASSDNESASKIWGSIATVTQSKSSRDAGNATGPDENCSDWEEVLVQVQKVVSNLSIEIAAGK